jgi:ATP-dependent helicase/nuclease subunit B
MTGFLAGEGPRWFHIPAHRPFTDDVARGLLDALDGQGPEALADSLILTPNRRGARAMAEAFLRVAPGRAILAPQVRPLGDLEAGEPPFEPADLVLDLPAGITPLRRRFELTRLVAELASLIPGGISSATQALEMADALGGFFDSLQIEEIDVGDKLAGLVDEAQADHWRASRILLETALGRWAGRLSELGLMDLAARRALLLRRLAELWRARPPEGVVIAAGSTGSAPATRALLAAVAKAPKGAVILPGLDTELGDAAWAVIDPQHPQSALKRLIDSAGLAHRDVPIWPASASTELVGVARQRLMNEALRPADATADWLPEITRLAADGALEIGLAGLSRVRAANEDEAAAVVALLLREALETPDRTAALITPDAALARRVAARLARWGVVAESSAGTPLGLSRAGALAGLVARAAVDPLDPVALLGILKHPFVRLGSSEPLEVERGRTPAVLRGPRARNIAGLRARAEAISPEALLLIDRLDAVLAPLAEDGDAPAERARRLCRVLEALCEGGPGDPWIGPEGEALSRLLGGLMRDGEVLPETDARTFGELLRRLMESETVRAPEATHPRLRILGALEARMVRADRVILAGLEDGVWPQPPPQDPFLSRPMRKALGLPPPEQRIGLSAHDFVQAACAPEVILVDAERRGDSPAVKSRWLWRLETLARGAHQTLPERADVLAWARKMDAPEALQRPIRPAPCPPLSARPRALAVTRVETLTRDPYAVWARDILKLYPMRRPDEAPDARERGTAIHAAFETFTRRWPLELPDDAAARFESLYVDALVAAGLPPEDLARERALAVEAARWVVEQERERRADGRTLHVEVSGRWTFPINGVDFTLSAKADRIEVLPDGRAHILDFKTGAAPSKEQVETGFSPQLTLSGAILQAGGFISIGPRAPGDLTYVEVRGRKPAGKVEIRGAAGEQSEALVAAALEGLHDLIASYDEPTATYGSRTAPQFVKTYASDYDHLARVAEWSTGADEGEGEG